MILSISWGHPLTYVLIQQAVGCWHTCERSFWSCEMSLNALQVTRWGMTQRALFHYVGEKKQKPQQKQALNSYREAWNRQKLILKACIAWKNRKETALRSRQTKQNSCTEKHVTWLTELELQIWSSSRPVRPTYSTEAIYWLPFQYNPHTSASNLLLFVLCHHNRLAAINAWLK